MSRTIGVLLCAAVVIQPFGSVAFAAEPAATATPTAAAQACAVRYIAALHMDKTTKAMTDAMMQPLVEMMTRPGQTKAEAEIQADIIDVMNEATAEITPKVVADMQPALTKVFTEVELCTMSDFYESPIGQSVIARMPMLSGEIAKATAKYMPEMQQRIFERLCKRLSCKGTPLEKLVPS